jgi:transposase InsO family protein
LVARAARTSSNIYVLSEIGNEKWCLGKEDESWLWHRRMGHMHFDNLVKVSKREAIREMPQIMKPTNTLCKNCQLGKQTKTRFKSKEYSTTKPLEIVHTDLEFTSKEFMDYYSNHGIKRQFSVAKTPQQNGVVERKNGTIQEMA